MDKTSVDKLKLEIEFLSLEPKPNFINSIFYSYCYIGILTGPYFKYRTYQDWLNTKSANEIVDSFSFMTKRGRTAPFIILAFLFLSKFVSFQVGLLN